jgi:hypothetical protein
MLRGVDLNGEVIGRGTLVRTSGLSQTAYDALRIAAWALVIVGGLPVALGPFRCRQRLRRTI